MDATLPATPEGTGDRDDRVERTYALAYAYEQQYGACSQCVIAALQDVFGVLDDATFKASHVMAAGGGLSTRGTCGALMGAMMAFGALYGRDRAGFKTQRSREALTHAKAVMDEFVAEFGSPVCGEVQTRLMGRSFDLWDADDFQRFEDAGAHADKCPKVVATAASIAARKLVALGR